VVVEASGPTWSFVDQIAGQVLTVVVVDPRKTKLKAGYAAKTDRLDARRLADALRRDSVVAVYIPPKPIRDLRELCRYRCALVRTQVAVKQRIHALLVRQGIPLPTVSDLFGQRGQQWLTRVTLDGWAGHSLAGLCALGAQIHAQLTPLERHVERIAREDPIVQALDHIPGLGPVLALMIRAEIGAVNRFARPAQLASYARLVPYVHQSGSSRHYGRITKHGSPWLRWALVEAAIHGVKRHDAVGRWARRLAVQKGGLKARVAVARLLCYEIFRAWQSVERLSAPTVDEHLATPCVAD
jgi:transposase